MVVSCASAVQLLDANSACAILPHLDQLCVCILHLHIRLGSSLAGHSNIHAGTLECDHHCLLLWRSTQPHFYVSCRLQVNFHSMCTVSAQTPATHKVFVVLTVSAYPSACPLTGLTLVSLADCIANCTALYPILGKLHRMHTTPTCMCLCRLKTIRFFANRMSQWTADLTPSQQHHFRDAYEAELCARQAFQAILIGFTPAYTSGLLRDKSGYKVESEFTAGCLLQ